MEQNGNNLFLFLFIWMNHGKGHSFVSQHYKIIIATANWKIKHSFSYSGKLQGLLKQNGRKEHTLENDET